jgi:DNA-binding transcriptional LysR family regulator
MKFRINDLNNFLEVSGCRTMSEAARKLGITQPALSESIKRLEEDLESILLYRARTGITLTPAGEAVLKSAKNAWSFLSEVEGVHSQNTQFGSRVITIGCHPTVASYCLPQALRRLAAEAPDYKVNLRHGLSRVIQSEIQQGQIDIGLVVNPVPSPDMVMKKIGEDEVGVWIAPGGGTDKIFCDLALIQTQSILRKWKSQPADKVNTESLELIVRLTEEGLGYGVLPARAVKLLGAKLKKVEATPVYRDVICLLFRPEFGKSQVEKKVIAALSKGPVAGL